MRFSSDIRGHIGWFRFK